ncbi:hypothetical protein RvY_15679 [Ramazzottius varieornatus]|uniref:protein-tyrosine-phosphatase n=1 Tax=Ramazzottius varieornatus TaxID=947166 RepID=A0A1D1W2H9_RAMVA|nr:hypothetical protein RvY_15679 [Ramazzottius varieornatus]
MDVFCKIEDQLYLGSYESICHLQEQLAADGQQLPERTVAAGATLDVSVVDGNPTVSGSDILALKGSAVLTIDRRQLPKDITQFFSAYKFIDLEDGPTSELIPYFDATYTFIKENKALGRNVLIHCSAGVSRSASIVCAYLMREYDISVEEALSRIRQSRSRIMPNSCFMDQLQLYRKMGYRADFQHPAYRQWRLRLTTQTGYPTVHINDLLAEVPANGSTVGNDVFFCRMCRCPLFSSSNQLAHSAKPTEPADEQGDRLDPGVCNQKEIFIEPVMWMKDNISDAQGKLFCPNCRKKVGSYAWFGISCPCGAFVTPSFHMDKSKVEIRKGIPAGAPSKSVASPVKSFPS